jgi:DNA-binding NtrC family response regulator
VANVLIAEDEIELAETLAEILRSAGHVVRVAANGDDGLRIASEFPADLVVSDWALGDSLDGVSLIERLRAARPAVRGILMTGYPSARLRAWAEADEALGLLEKPFSLSDFRTLVARALGVNRPA